MSRSPTSPSRPTTPPRRRASTTSPGAPAATAACRRRRQHGHRRSKPSSSASRSTTASPAPTDRRATTLPDVEVSGAAPHRSGASTRCAASFSYSARRGSSARKTRRNQSWSGSIEGKIGSHLPRRQIGVHQVTRQHRHARAVEHAPADGRDPTEPHDPLEMQPIAAARRIPPVAKERRARRSRRSSVCPAACSARVNGRSLRSAVDPTST